MIEDKKDGTKIVSKEEKYWLGIKSKCEESILAHKRNTIIDEALLGLAEFKIKEQKLV